MLWLVQVGAGKLWLQKLTIKIHFSKERQSAFLFCSEGYQRHKAAVKKGSIFSCKACHPGPFPPSGCWAIESLCKVNCEISTDFVTRSRRLVMAGTCPLTLQQQRCDLLHHIYLNCCNIPSILPSEYQTSAQGSFRQIARQTFTRAVPQDSPLLGGYFGFFPPPTSAK